MLVQYLVGDMPIFSSRIYISLLTTTVVGYVWTAVTAFEHDGVAQLTVAVSVPSQTYEMEHRFSLFVNILDGTATGV